jgi:SAM-dependent methyltransferase
MTHLPSTTMACTSDVEPWLRALLVCPACRSGLRWSGETVCCQACLAGFPVIEGIPVFIDLAADADVDSDYKRRQVEFFDHEAADFETTRPHGAPALYRWLMGEKQRRAIVGIESLLPSATVVTVCGGSGMDAEYLARHGARVIVTDLSLGAVRRARERGVKHGLDLVPVVADAEHLPFRDGAVTAAFVHDGLHHLQDPLVGAAEMARVAGLAVSINEPARAAATAIAMRVGIAHEREDAGNTVERISTHAIEDILIAAGYRMIGAERYAMYYQHVPGAWMRFLSRDRLFPIATSALRGFNRVAGAVGNKSSVRAVRARPLT